MPSEPVRRMSWSPNATTVRPSPLAAVAVATLVVLAGCATPGGSTGPAESTPSPSQAGESPSTAATTPPQTTDTSAARTTDAATTRTTDDATTRTTAADPDEGIETVRVENGTLPVNASLVFHRVEELLGVDANPPVITINPSGYHGATPDPDPFERLVGLARPDVPLPNLTYRAGGSGEFVVLLFTNTTLEEVPPEDLEVTLAHEFVHVIQDQRRWADGSLFPDGLDPEVQTALIEGGAVYVSDVYAQRYGVTKADGRTPIDHRANDYRTRPAWILPATADYYFGGRYLDRRLDDPGELWDAYADPPSTMEGVIHGPGVEPARPLSVTVDAPGWIVNRRGPQGEHLLRASLRSELPREDAAAAATGWGNDSLVRFDADGDTGFAWVLRWDDAAEADEFEDALRRFADRRRGTVDGSFAVVRATPETVALLAGPASFVRATNVTGAGGNVTVTVDGTG